MSEQLVEGRNALHLALGICELKFVVIKHDLELRCSLFSQGLDDNKNLVGFVFALEDGAADEHLGKDAADGPHVDCICILLPGSHNFRRTVPSRRDVVG